MAEEQKSKEDFQAMLLGLSHGQFVLEVNKTMRDVLKAVSEQSRKRGKAKGELTIKIKFSSGEVARELQITGECTAKQPSPPKATALRFVTPSGDVVKSDPLQEDLPGTDAPGNPHAAAAPVANPHATPAPTPANVPHLRPVDGGKV